MSPPSEPLSLALAWRKLRTLWRYVWPTAQDRDYLDAIADSGLFDRAFYLTSNPGLKRIFRIWPERHYVQLGEAHGCSPTPVFSPRAYLHQNPDLATEPRLFLHFLREGRAGKRSLRGSGQVPVMPEVSAGDRQGSGARFAVALHLYYLDLWPEIATRLAAQQIDADLLVTVTDQPWASEVRDHILAEAPGARVWIIPNHGRDIWPFAWLVGQGLLSGYDAVAKLHTKKSPHLQVGEIWRAELMQEILGDPARTAIRLDRFLQDRDAGLWANGANILNGDKWWSINRARGDALAARTAISLEDPLQFPAGSMYWIKPQVVQALAQLALTAEDFEIETGLVDGTTAHAMERLMGPLVQHAGLSIVAAKTLDLN